MVYADANILIRFILKDNKEMAEKATEAITNGDVFVLNEVFAEVVYVLDKVYNTERQVISDYLVKLLEYVMTDESNVLKMAFSCFSETKLDFVDCLLAAYHIVDKKEILTFDKKLNNFIKRNDNNSQNN